MGLLTMAILVALAALTSQKPQNSYNIHEVLNIPQIGSAMQEFIVQSPQGDGLDDTDKIKHHSKNNKNSNLMNLQKPVVIFEGNNLKKRLAAAEHSLNKPQSNANQKVLRDIEEAICETTGRCGCSGTRCGCSGDRCNDENKDRDYNSEELSKILDSLQSDLENDRSSSSDLRCGCKNNQPHRGYNSPRMGQRYNLRCGCKSKRPYKRTSKNNKDKNYDENDRETSNDDDLNVVLLELNDLLDKKSNHRDYTRSKDLTREDNSQKPVYRNNDEVIETNNNRKGVSPDVFIDHYQKFKATTIYKLMRYILYQKHGIDLTRLSKRQKKIVKRLQEEAKSKFVDIDKLETRLVSLIFGPESAVKVLPHKKSNENIYVPQYVYNKLRNSQAYPLSRTGKEKAFLKMHPRSVLPLTKRQKLRLQKLIQKQQSEAVRPQVWRRSLTEDLQNYGAPFELDIQGLGQFNAK
ncbi:uncharacterized protein [Choristoneura fumiferana]|uniref:uncharacterized protein n=1 Tax=Choristoneura fumiferana TaxID=7141 RepID=UPI003D154A18